jgi:zinc protease
MNNNFMMHSFRRFFGWLAFVALMPTLIAQGPPQKVETIPLDPNIRTGVLPNGMTYFVHQNKEPENRMELRLVVNAGSVLEDDDQQGLAHFVEHMAFNGSEHFKKNELVDFLESAGVKFGPHLNAYTSFDETVYMVQVATDNPTVVDKGLLILQDWAMGLSFDHNEIDKERGVVIEEWRMRSGAESRMMDKFMPVLVNGSHYANRLPIGEVEILKNFKYETIKRFYKKWYRPDLMAVIAVGDFDLAEMEKKIVAKFSEVPASTEKLERPTFPIPDHEEVVAAVETDKEAGYVLFLANFKHELTAVKTEADYRDLLVDMLAAGMLTDRLEELKQKGESPLMFSQATEGPMFGMRSKSAFTAIAVMNPSDITGGVKQVLTEMERARRHGFIETELERQKSKMISEVETSYNDRDKTESKDLAGKTVQYFLVGRHNAGITWSFETIKKLMPGISVDEINARIQSRLADRNGVLVLTGPEKESIKIPGKEDLLAAYREVQKSEVEPYKELIDDRPLVPELPEPGTIAESNTTSELGLTEWKLSNGARIILRPTDFKDDEIFLRAFSPGGLSRLSDSDYKKAWAVDGVIGNSGVGRFNLNTLGKKLAGKQVNVAPYIDDLFEGMNGQCSPKDVEAMMQLVHLFFVQPRRDKEGFNSFRQMMEGVAGFSSSPEGSFQDSLTIFMSGNHPRRQPITKQRIDELDLQTIFMTYMDRFLDPSDFTFVLVGNFKPEEIKPLILQYIGGIEGNNRKESWKDREIKGPEGIVEMQFNKGADDKSIVNLAFTGPMEYNRENEFELQAMTSVLRIMLRESMREEKGGVYGVRCNAKAKKLPKSGYRIDIGFTCAPDRVEELVETAMEEVRRLREDGPSEKNMVKVQEIERRSYETDMRDNNFWVEQLVRYYQYDADPRNMLNYLPLVDGMNPDQITEAAKRYLNTENVAKVVMYPDEKGDGAGNK